MAQVQNNIPIYNYPTGASSNNTASNPNTQQPQIVNVSTPNGNSQIYQYPNASLYDPSQKGASSASVAGASGVNIYIYNPSAIGGPTSNSNASANYQLPPNGQAPAPQVVANSPIAPGGTDSNNTTNNTTNNITNNQQNNRLKPVVELTDEYIQTLESALRSDSSKIREDAIIELINRFEEDNKRFDDPALTALLNIALQDQNTDNRILAASMIAAGQAHGDDNTIAILEEMLKSEKGLGQEAKVANKALLKVAGNRVYIQDDSPVPKPKDDDDKDEEDKLL